MQDTGDTKAMTKEQEEYVERVTRFLVPIDDKDARSRLTLDGIYDGQSLRISAMVRLAYRRGVRRGAAAAWGAQQKITTRA